MYFTAGWVLQTGPSPSNSEHAAGPDSRSFVTISGPKDSMVHYIENQSVVICCLSRFGRLQPGGTDREPTRE
ncbi:hypothetical protein SPRA44_260099 [Serratia proteamaculans]|nr:hypothetical protein SPRA44_260099 [Serratia proteamaculans]